jgi:hypothetical protein
MSSQFESFASLPFGGVNPSTLTATFDNKASDITSMGFLLKMVIISNIPQLVLTVMYFLHNRAYTCMVGMYEYTDFYFKRRSLRVSYPTGIQRSTYWLQLPYRYGIPLLVASGLLHWIVSESVFLVRISFFDRNGNPITDCKWCTPSSSILTLLGYSPKALMVAIVLGGVMVVILITTGLRHFKSGMPIVRNSSWSIAAACHPPHGDYDAAHKRVMWGAISHPNRELMGHCCFTSFPVKEPINSLRYK